MYKYTFLISLMCEEWCDTIISFFVKSSFEVSINSYTPVDPGNDKIYASYILSLNLGHENKYSLKELKDLIDDSLISKKDIHHYFMMVMGNGTWMSNGTNIVLDKSKPKVKKLNPSNLRIINKEENE
jgi:hypothetical protein